MGNKHTYLPGSTLELTVYHGNVSCALTVIEPTKISLQTQEQQNSARVLITLQGFLTLMSLPKSKCSLVKHTKKKAQNQSMFLSPRLL